MFEWSSLGIGEPAFEVPQMAAGEPLTPYYGVIHRTEDWPDVLEEVPGAIDAHGFLASSREPRLVVCPALFKTSQPRQAVSLCAWFDIGQRPAYPLINESEPPGWSDGDLMIGDMGSLYLFLDRQVAFTRKVNAIEATRAAQCSGAHIIRVHVFSWHEATIAEDLRSLVRCRG